MLSPGARGVHPVITVGPWRTDVVDASLQVILAEMRVAIGRRDGCVTEETLQPVQASPVDHEQGR